jgi:hypothetical protein
MAQHEQLDVRGRGWVARQGKANWALAEDQVEQNEVLRP